MFQKNLVYYFKVQSVNVKYLSNKLFNIKDSLLVQITRNKDEKVLRYEE